MSPGSSVLMSVRSHANATGLQPTRLPTVLVNTTPLPVPLQLKVGLAVLSVACLAGGGAGAEAGGTGARADAAGTSARTAVSAARREIRVLMEAPNAANAPELRLSD